MSLMLTFVSPVCAHGFDRGCVKGEALCVHSAVLQLGNGWQRVLGATTQLSSVFIDLYHKSVIAML